MREAAAQRVGRAPSRLVVDVRQHDVGALRRQRRCNRLPDPGRPTGDDRGLASDIHGGSMVFACRTTSR
jgi:hypothetical protein